MKENLIGYVRVSTNDQNASRQLEGIKLDKIFTDHTTAKDTNRPALKEMLNYVRDGDVIVVHSIDRLARNLIDLKGLITNLTKKGIEIRFMKENLKFSDKDSHMDNLLLAILGAFAEFERVLIKERQVEGIAIAKNKGLYKGRKRKLTNVQVLEIKEKIKKGVAKKQIAKEYSISRETLYNYCCVS